MAVVPGEQIGALRRAPAATPAFAPSSALLRSWPTDVAEPRTVNKPGKSYPRPLADLLHKTLADVFAKQGFASTELVTRWTDIVGAEIAAHSEPVKIQWPRPPTDNAGARHPGAAGRGAGGDRNPAPLRRDPRTRQPVLRLAGGRRLAAAAGAAAPRAADALPRLPIARRRRASPPACPRSRTTSCAARLPGSAPPSNGRDRRRGLAQAAVPLPHSGFGHSDQARQNRLNRTDTDRP